MTTEPTIAPALTDEPALRAAVAAAKAVYDAEAAISLGKGHNRNLADDRRLDAASNALRVAEWRLQYGPRHAAGHPEAGGTQQPFCWCCQQGLEPILPPGCELEEGA